jgi:hypothetical protein
MPSKCILLGNVVNDSREQKDGGKRKVKEKNKCLSKIRPRNNRATD